MRKDCEQHADGPSAKGIDDSSVAPPLNSRRSSWLMILGTSDNWLLCGKEWICIVTRDWMKPHKNNCHFFIINSNCFRIFHSNSDYTGLFMFLWKRKAESHIALFAKKTFVIRGTISKHCARSSKQIGYNHNKDNIEPHFRSNTMLDKYLRNMAKYIKVEEIRIDRKSVV